MKKEYLVSDKDQSDVEAARLNLIERLRLELRISPLFNLIDYSKKVDFRYTQGRVQVYSLQGSGSDRSFNVATTNLDIEPVLQATARAHPGLDYKIIFSNTLSPSESIHKKEHEQSDSS